MTDLLSGKHLAYLRKALKTMIYVTRISVFLELLVAAFALFVTSRNLIVTYENQESFTSTMPMLNIAALLASILLLILVKQHWQSGSEAFRFLDKVSDPTTLKSEFEQLLTQAKSTTSSSASQVSELKEQLNIKEISPSTIKAALKSLKGAKSAIEELVEQTNEKFDFIKQGLSVLDAISPSFLMALLSFFCFASGILLSLLS